ncbi:molybdopterin biosynthesis protein, partial [Methanosarcinales archaeon]
MMMKRKEFHELIPIKRAEQILKSIIRSSTEVVPIDLAYHRILADDVVAAIDVPTFDRADMDGYAVRAADTYTAREEDPVSLEIIDRIPAGDVSSLTISSGEAAEIGTGAMLPDGADAVVMVEYTEQNGSSVSVQRAVHSWEN